jgi:DNA-binding SARP family transcriptional activator
MLATSRMGERSRRWLQERLWGSRERYNSQASLRRELSNLRRIVNSSDGELLIVEREAVTLNLGKVIVDIRDPARVAATREDFLEGIDLAREEGFEDWLRDERQSIDAAREGRGRRFTDQPGFRQGAGADGVAP